MQIDLSQTVGASTTTYLWDDFSTYGDVVVEQQASTTTVYTLGNGQLISQARNGTYAYYFFDGQGNVRALLNTSGTQTANYTYLPFGEMDVATGSAINTYRFAGQQFDATITGTGLYKWAILPWGRGPTNLNPPYQPGITPIASFDRE